MNKRDLERFRKRLAKQYAKHLTQEEIPQLLIIRSHLYVETTLNALIETKVQPVVLETLTPTFARKIDLAAKLKLLPPHWVEPVRLLNRYRNRAAHKLYDDIRRADQTEFYKACVKAGFFKSADGSMFHARMRYPWLLNVCLRILIVVLLARLQSAVEKRRRMHTIGVGFVMPSHPLREKGQWAMLDIEIPA